MNMAPVPMLRIKTIETKPNYRLLITWSAGPRATINFTKIIAQGGVFSALRDVKLFNKVRIGERSRTIEWPEPSDELGYPMIDIDAESLMAMYSSQKQDEILGKIHSAIGSIITKKHVDREGAF